ncbi:hypothetical protein CN205_24110 [Sinorhizobium meliloti]|uniref:hypothetical protein n=1 Tax=Rhizobium meliloti TaxID=382 RepID=UPI000FDBB792|nr:hypothetical protein [Sinorhizobium meliloti]RVI03192.1 hypothetical protein CN205_24110 [Sinorhizobium meliloti]
MSNDFSELRIQHLEMIQAVIARLAGNNASHKNYCISLIMGAFGLAATLQKPLIAALAFLPVVAFAVLDAQYLRLEKRYRELFERVRLESPAERPDFRLHTTGLPQIGFWTAFASWSIQAFYLPTIAGVLFITILLEVFYGSTLF